MPSTSKGDDLRLSPTLARLPLVKVSRAESPISTSKASDILYNIGSAEEAAHAFEQRPRKPEPAA